MTTPWRSFKQYCIALLFLAAGYPLQMKAQYVIKDNIKTLYEKDSVVIILDEFRGKLQWEISKDLINWTALPGKTQKTLALHVDSSGYYRALITEGTCDPLYSDTVLIAELLDERDQQFYDIVNIGGQWWMAENLKFRSATGSWFYKDDSSRFESFGRLYNWQKANSVCPTDWHLPSDNEWILLEITAGLDPAEAYYSEWRGEGILSKVVPGGSTGLKVLYAGFRTPDAQYNGGNLAGIFWTSSQASANEHWYRGFNSSFTGSHRIFLTNDYGLSVRCVKNDVPLVYTDSIHQVSDTSVMIAGTLFDSRGGSVINRGFCWSTLPDPTPDQDHLIVAGTDSGFHAHITGLKTSTAYYIRAFASSTTGVGYGNTFTFTTSGPVPVLITTPVTSVTVSSAQSGGNIMNTKGLQITGRGVCWDTKPSPTVSHFKTDDGTGAGIFTSALTGLTPNTQYYLRAYVTTAAGPFYGNELPFKTPPLNETGSFTDGRNGKTYGTVKIGYQWWMSQNLDFYTASGSGYYKYDSTLYSENGRLYNIVTALNICPSGWHLPADEEWKQLEIYLGMDTSSVSKTGWRGTNQGARLLKGSADGFNADLAGYLYQDGRFYDYGIAAAYWTSTQFESSGTYWYRGINTSSQQIHREKYNNISMHAVRCVKNDKPVVATDSVGTIGENSAIAYCSVLSDGGRPITVKGVCWSKTPNPTTAGAHISDGSGNASYSLTLTGLDQGSTYYLRPYATNDQGTSYGEEVTFITLPALPVLTTAAVSSVTSTSAVCGGQIVNNKGFAITARGVCWSTLKFPTLADPHTTNGSGNGSFTSFMSGLTPNKVYYVRAYATSVAGTGYGNQDSFRTAVEFPMSAFTDARDGRVYQSITIGDQQWMAENLRYNRIPGSVYYNNDSADYYAYGRMYTWQAAMNSCPAGWHLPTDDEWKTLEMAMGMSVSVVDNSNWRGTTEAYKLMEGGTSGFEVLYGGFCEPSGKFGYEGQIGAFWSSTESGVNNAWYRGFNISHGDIHRYAYSKDYKYSVRCLKNVLPVLTTATATGITDSSAYSGGTISYDGGAPVTARGVCWGLSHNPTIAGDTTNNGSGTGSYVSYMLGLSPGKTYYVRAYATNSVGTAYGSEISMTTQTSVPRVTTATVSSITDSSAVCGGTITSSGGLTISGKGVCWNTTGNPTIANDRTVDGSGTASFVSNLVNLSPNITYYVRAYATNSAGTGYGNLVSFKTSTALPVVTTSAVTAITSYTATSGGNVTSDGGSAVTARGVCWSTTVNPTTEDDMTNNGTGTGTFSSTLTNLLPNTPYYVRAYATNSAGTAYGNQVTFTTPDDIELPVVTTSAVTNITDNSASSGGDVTSDGGAAITARGICWSTSQNPTVSSFIAESGSGTGSFSANLTGLNDRTKYYVRAYATNTAGTAYGNEQSFTTTLRTGTMNDARDGQDYATVKAGSSWWLAENLNYSVAGSAYYGDSATYAETYGRLYTWTAMMNGAASSNMNPSGIQGICPTGWHVPSNSEWTELVTSLGGSSIAGSELKEEGTAHWADPNSDATNASGFTARPAGMLTETLVPGDVTTHAYFWTATEYDGTTANVRWLNNNSASVANSSYGKDVYLSVRCKKD